ncbi:MAG: hypothetical protein A3J46_05805 [Candidatus Yanofskybacteria bacterium RIFCSPHIGHO2_02_FULL_41_11]|uniref:prolyl oligopeptidase n=1 Tax=Candidatus Yanofskybacteria bacterium RIFCSPHIGHO2_02_FULL_41_11 TaxID=1802675 RepID=A0A1F8F5J2_9BACT|nr:MAG: hypothetical protein A3J46_05805 [Candidatus Yanofskybacteria bacterium RIFCSPHIGHO2_02_FULL_41_11]
MVKFPETKKVDLTEEIYGYKVSDPYRWLEDTESPEVGAWLDEQDKFARSILNSLPLRGELKEEFRNLFYEETIGFPHSRKGRYFIVRRKADQNLEVLYTMEGLNGEPRILVNPNELSKKAGSVINLAGYSTSKDGKFISYGLSETNNDQAKLCVMSVDTGEKLEDEIPGELYPSPGSWSLDNKGFWYTRRKADAPKGEEKFHRKVYYHRLGTSFDQDELVYGKDLDKQAVPFAYETHDGKYLILTVRFTSGKARYSDSYIMDLADRSRGFVPIVEGIQGDGDTYFGATVHRGYVYIATNYKASLGKMMRVPVSQVEKGVTAWEEVLPEGKGVLEHTVLVQDKLFVTVSENVHSVLREYTLEGNLKRDIDLPTPGTCQRFSAEPEGDELFFLFESFVFPPAVYRIDLKTDKAELFKQMKVNADISDVQTNQVWYSSKDGTRVPMFLIYKKELTLEGDNPILLNGYGGFNISRRPLFMKGILPFINRGGVYAIANIRGGGEFGEEWHKAGIKELKQNSFDDFISATEWLIEHKYTNSKRLAIEGGSNGGLLVGAVMTQRPELFKAVIMSVPVADMLRYHLFHGGRYWIADYGDPDNKEMFPYLFKYSPYHNVKDGVEYPTTLITTSDKDDRVHPGAAFKMAARLQEVNKENLIVLRVERKAGHVGAADVARFIESSVDKWSFVFSELNITK